MKQGMNGSNRARTITRVVAVVATTMIVFAGCRPQGGTFERQARQAQRTTPNKRPWFCNSVGQGTPLSGHGNGSHVHPVYEGKTKGPLSWADCVKLATELDATVKAVKGFETKAKGEAAGWRQVASYIPGLGTHHAKTPGGLTPGSTPGSTPGGSVPGGTMPGNAEIARIVACLQEKGVTLTGGIPNFSDPVVAEALRACGVTLPPGGGIPGVTSTFDPAKPPILIYGGPNPDSPLVGVAYAFTGAAQPPEAYTGGNDWWHLHSKICIGPNREILAGAEEISDAQCAALGGRQTNLSFGGTSGGIWLLHVWLMPPYEYRPDIFVSGHNCLMADGVAPQSDPCWKIAHRDPSQGLPPTTAHPTTPTTPTVPTTAGPTTPTTGPVTPTTPVVPTTPTTHGGHGH